MRKVTRRGILAGLLATGATPADALLEVQAPPVECEIPIGYIIPRISHELMPINIAGNFGGYSPVQAVCKIVHEIWDGEKFLPLESEAGQQLLKRLGA